MDYLDNYINKLLIQTKEFTELEKVRYVYLDLGKIMSFDLLFYYGNEKNKRKIYKECESKEEKLANALKSGIGICKSIAYLLEYILTKLNIKTKSIVDYGDIVYYRHVTNMIYLTDGTKFEVDLQHDLENIQAHQKTRYFGKGFFSEEKLEQLDLKVNYISEDNRYTEEYYYLLEKSLTKVDNLEQKLEFVLSNINAYTNMKKVNYLERKYYYIRFLSKFFTQKEKNHIAWMDSYYMGEGLKSYSLCIILEGKENFIYLFSEDLQKFQKYTLNEIANMVQNGLVILGNIPGLKIEEQKKKVLS